MITPAQAVQAAAATYDNIPSIVGQGRFSPVRATLTVVGGELVVAFEGTVDKAGWLLDFDALIKCEPSTHELGHAGFTDGAESTLDQISAAIGKRTYYLTGHSLGAALALETAGLLAARGQTPAKIFLFAPPRVYLMSLPKVIEDTPKEAYWYGNDPVPFAPLGWFQIDRPEMNLVGHPVWPPRAAHHIRNYLAAVTGTAIAA